MTTKLLVRMPNWVGDLVMATPVLTELRHHFPEAEITAMCPGHVASLLEHDRDIDALFTFSPVSGWEKKDEERALVAHLREGRYDIGVLLTNSFSSAWWLWRGRVKQRIGFKGDWRSALLTHAVPFPLKRDHQHLVETYKSLLTPLGIRKSDASPRIHMLSEELSGARSLLAKYGIAPEHKVVGINPGAAYGSAKCWPPERFSAVLQKLVADPQMRVVLFGDSSQISLTKRICGGVHDQVLNLAGATSLRQLAALIGLCDVFLTNDSGPMHIAAALGTPLLALFGSTSEIKTGPYGQGERVIHKHVECSPCYLRTCPVDFRCMKRIEADEVVEALRALLCRREAAHA